jgi:hypothetical protein
MPRTLLLLIALSVQSIVALSQERPCSQAEAQQSESEADTLRTWDALYNWYRLYARCNDVSAAEGSSESVARILVDHWSSLPRLSQLATGDKEFGRFVLSHIDATLETNDLKKIAENATQHCPAALLNLYKDLKKEAVGALMEGAGAK